MDTSGHTLVLNMKSQMNNCDVRFAIFTTAMHTYIVRVFVTCCDSYLASTNSSE